MTSLRRELTIQDDLRTKYGAVHHIVHLVQILFLPRDGRGEGLLGEELLDWVNGVDPGELLDSHLALKLTHSARQSTGKRNLADQSSLGASCLLALHLTLYPAGAAYFRCDLSPRSGEAPTRTNIEVCIASRISSFIAPSIT